jgi:hypothetical protein
MPELEFLEEYSGQTVEELLSFEGQYHCDSLVLAFEQALRQKLDRCGGHVLTSEERIILAVEALEREVNNGGYGQFFINSSREFAPVTVSALLRIGCPKTAAVTQRAIDALHLAALSVEAIDAAMEASEESEEELNQCDDSYYGSGEDVAGNLFAFIRTNQSRIMF